MRAKFLEGALMIAVAFGLFLAGVFATSFIQKPPTSSADWASWVQAVGSILAIAGAYFFGERQANKAAELASFQRTQAEKDRHAAYLAIATAAHTYVSGQCAHFMPDKVEKFGLFMTYDEKISGHIIDALNAVPVHELGSPDSVDLWIRTKNAFIYFQKAIAFYVEHVNQDFGGEPADRAGNPDGVLQCGRYLDACYVHLEMAMCAD